MVPKLTRIGAPMGLCEALSTNSSSFMVNNVPMDTPGPDIVEIMYKNLLPFNLVHDWYRLIFYQQGKGVAPVIGLSRAISKSRD